MPHAALWVEQPSAAPYAEYAASCLLAPLGWTVALVDAPHLAGASMLISYGERAPEAVVGPHLHIAASDFFGAGFGSPRSIPGGPLVWDGELPVLFQGGERHQPFLQLDAGLVFSRVDVLAGSFFLLSGYEEAVVFGKDAAGRMLAHHGVAGREGFLDWPVVDLMRERLQGWLAHLGLPHTRLNPWGAAVALAVTHDLMPHHLAPALARWRHARAWRKAVPDRVAAWLAAEGERHLHATYFLPVRRRNERLPLGRSALQLAEVVLAGGGEVAGSLPAGRAAHHPQRAIARLEQGIRRPIRGVRQAGWRWDPVTLNALLHRRGFDYDCSLGYPERPSFRAGTAWPFRLFDLGRRRPVDVWEVPVLATAGQWLGARQDRIEQALRRFGGLMAIDWSLDDHLPAGAYATFLQRAEGQGVRLGGVSQLLDHYLAELPPRFY